MSGEQAARVAAARRDVAAADQVVEDAEGALAGAELHRDDCRDRLEQLLTEVPPAPLRLAIDAARKANP